MAVNEGAETLPLNEQLRLAWAAIESTSTGIVVADARIYDCPIIFVNHAFESMTGFTREEVVGKNCRFLQGAETDPLSVARLRAALTDRSETSVVLANYRRDGTLFWNCLSISPIFDGVGELSHFVGIQQDVTQQVMDERELENLLEYNRLILESTSEGIYGIDLAGNCTFVNQTAATMLGLDPGVMFGANVHTLIHHSRPDGSPLPLEECSIHLELGSRQVVRTQDAFWRGDGQSIPVEYSSSPIMQNGAPTGAVIVFSDITDRLAAERDLRDAKEKADEANQAKSAFLANMSHELRTPLNAVIGYCELLQEENEDGPEGEVFATLEKIRAAGLRLLGLVNDVLDLSKVEAGKMELASPETFVVADLVKELVVLVEPMMHGNSNTLEVRCDASLTMRADSGKVRQCLLNLLSNAAKFTSSGTVTISATEEAGATQVRFVVTDTGIGMAATQLEEVFEPFNQVDRSASRRFAGTGLGLTLTRRFAQMMGGEVEVVSEPGAGSTFTVTLPKGTTRSSGNAVVESARAVQILLLVVADDPSIWTVAVPQLKGQGWKVLIARSAAEALVIARRTQPTVVVVDLSSRHDAWQDLCTLKEDETLVPVPFVVCSGPDAVVLPYPQCPTEFLTKPVDGQRLRQALRRLRPESATGQVLIVEDDEITRHMLRSILSRSGYEVAEASNGAEALLMVEAAIPDVILLDLIMPTMNGFDFLDALRRDGRWNRLPVVVVTAKDLDPRELRLLDGHVATVLQKGQYAVGDLVTRIHDVIVDDALEG